MVHFIKSIAYKLQKSISLRAAYPPPWNRTSVHCAIVYYAYR